MRGWCSSCFIHKIELQSSHSDQTPGPHLMAITNDSPLPYYFSSSKPWYYLFACNLRASWGLPGGYHAPHRRSATAPTLPQNLPDTFPPPSSLLPPLSSTSSHLLLLPHHPFTFLLLYLYPFLPFPKYKTSLHFQKCIYRPCCVQGLHWLLHLGPDWELQEDNLNRDPESQPSSPDPYLLESGRNLLASGAQPVNLC